MALISTICRSGWQSDSRGEQLRQHLQGKSQITAVDHRVIQMTSQCQSFHLKVTFGVDGIHERSSPAKAPLLAATHGRLGASYRVGASGERNIRQVVEAICALMDQLRPQGAPHGRLITLVSDRPGHDTAPSQKTTQGLTTHAKACRKDLIKSRL